MKDKKAFTVAEVLTTLTIVAVLSTMAIWLVNKDGIERREYLGRYNMILPQLEEIAALTAQNSNYFEDWWAESNSLIGLECDSENPSVCLREAFMSSTSNLRECDDDDECFPNRDEVNNRLQTIYADLGGVNINDMQILQGVDAVYGLLYNDASCTTQLRSVNGRNIDACGVIFIDVNGRRRPNIMADQQIAGDRFLVALTRNGVEQTELMTAAAGCPENSYYDAQRRTCLEEHQCSVSQDAVNRAQALIAANANNPDTVSVSFPDGEEFADTCVTARCTMGLRPKPNGTCPGSCPAGEEFAGGLFLSDGGDIDDLLWENKLCCKPIRTQDELSDIRNATADTYCLMNDITLTGNWTPINNFTGKLFGNGFKINNLRISQSNLSSSTRIGFFRNLGANAVVKDIEFVNPQITVTTLDGNTTSYIGTLVGVGTATSNISNIVINNTEKFIFH